MKKFSCPFPDRKRICSVCQGRMILPKLLEKTASSYSNLFAVVDNKVLRLHRRGILSRIQGLGEVHSLPLGERSKSMKSASRVLEWLHDSKADRRSLIVGVGGGVATDLTGFVASTFMRGVDYVAVPTTLVGQVDAAIGGKTAVNLQGTKNIVGTFHLPRLVICEETFLDTLPASALKDGLIESLKAFLALDARAFERYKKSIGSLSRTGDLNRLIEDAIRLKTMVVSRDPYEIGLRKLLNFGHTTGHAYEAITGVSHGKSVALGMLVALNLSERQAGLSAPRRKSAAATILSIYRNFRTDNLKVARLWEKIEHDKKRSGREMNFVLLKSLGRHVVMPVTLAQFRSAWNETMELIKK